REEDTIETAGKARRQPAGERQRRLMNEPAEHDVRHQRELALDCGADVGMVIAVAGGPPRGDAVDEFAAIGEHDAAALRADDRQRQRRALHLRVGQPDMGEPGLVPIGPDALAFCLAVFFAGHSALPFDRHCRHAGARGTDAGSRMRSLDEFATAKLAELERSSLRRALVDTTRVTGVWLLRTGRRLMSSSCTDSLNLSHHPAAKDAAIEALRASGPGAGASRLVTGNHPLFAELEGRLARLKDAQAACIFGSGYLANLGIIPALVGPGDLVLIDELAHACLWAGPPLAPPALVPLPH